LEGVCTVGQLTCVMCIRNKQIEVYQSGTWVRGCSCIKW